MKQKLLLSLLSILVTWSFIVAQTTIDATIQHDNLTREYRLYVPAIYDGSEPVPLVFNFHGYGSNAAQQIFYGEFRPIADTANFILVIPQGTNDDDNSAFWNTFGGPETVDDVGFVSNLIDSLSMEYNIDPNRIYSAGMSNGGFMGYKLACELSNRITAIASVTGSMIFPELNACAPTRPVPVMQIHGTADLVVEYDGGDFFVPIDSLVSYWRHFNNCEADPMFTALPDIDNTDGCTAEHYVYGGGDLGSTVEFYKVLGGGHSWPGTILNLNVTNQDFNASVEIWRFFSQYELSQLTTSINAPQTELLEVSIFPNPSSGFFNLEFTSNEERTLIIANSIGQEVKREIVNGLNADLRIDEPGIYFITIDGKESRVSQKVVVF
ncbi:MAG: PHB depolymerase family esterase [Bacteroidota bacterium]